MKRFVLCAAVMSLLAIGLILSLQTTILAQATHTDFTGQYNNVLDNTHPDFERWVDGGGKIHFKNLRATGDFSLESEGIEIDGTHETLLKGWQDPSTGNSNFSGVWSVSVDGEVVLDGHWTGKEVARMFEGPFWFKGEGPYAGMKLSGTSTEIGTTAVFNIEGTILDPPGAH